MISSPAGQSPSYVTGYQPTARHAGPWLVAGRPPRSGEAILDRQAADQPHIRVGDRARILGQPLTLVGLSTGGTNIANTTAFIPTGDFARLRGPTQAYVLVGARPGVQLGALTARLEATPPGTTKAWVTQLPAATARQLVIHGGFVVDDGRSRRLERHARHLGFDNLHRYLQTRCDAGHSVPELAEELGVSEWTVTQMLARQGIVLPPRPQRLALQRRRHADQRISARVIELGFTDVRAYLADRLIEREWLLADVTAELGAHRATVRRLMQQLGVRRRRRTVRQLAVGEQGRRVQSVSWQARRAARLAELPEIVGRMGLRLSAAKTHLTTSTTASPS